MVERNPSTELKQQPQLLEEVDVRIQPEFIRHDCACDASSSVSSFCCGSQAYLRKKLAKAENKALVYGPMKSSWAAAMLKVDVYRQVRINASGLSRRYGGIEISVGCSNMCSLVETIYTGAKL